MSRADDAIAAINARLCQRMGDIELEKRALQERLRAIETEQAALERDAHALRVMRPVLAEIETAADARAQDAAPDSTPESARP